GTRTLTLVGFVAATTVVAGLYLRHALDQFAVEALESRLATAGRLLHDEARELLVRGTGPDDLARFTRRAAMPTGSRVAVIAPDGVVLGDSDIAPGDLSRLENHRERPEVRAALDGRVGRDLRTSVSLNAPLLYVALPVVDDNHRTVGVLRLALPLSAVTAAYHDLHRVMLVGGLVALLVAFGIGIFVAGRVTPAVGAREGLARRVSG